MAAILMMLPKFVTAGPIKNSYFKTKVIMSYPMSMTSSTKFYHATKIMLEMWSYDQSQVILAFLWDKLCQPQFYKNLTKNKFFLRGAPGSTSIIWN